MAENKNPPTSAGDMGLIPGPGRSHMLPAMRSPCTATESPPLDTIRGSLHAARPKKKETWGNTVL